MDFQDISLNEVKKYLDSTGRHGAWVLSLLGRVTPGLQSILETEIGKDILKDDIKRIEELMGMMYEEKSTEEDRAELRYLRKRIAKISDRLRIYLEGTEEIKKVVSD
jgi:hypothetical protein